MFGPAIFDAAKRDRALGARRARDHRRDPEPDRRRQAGREPHGAAAGGRTPGQLADMLEANRLVLEDIERADRGRADRLQRRGPRGRSRPARGSSARRSAARRSSAPARAIRDAYVGPYTSIDAGVTRRALRGRALDPAGGRAASPTSTRGWRRACWAGTSKLDARRRRAEDAADDRRRQLGDRDPVRRSLVTGAGGMLGRDVVAACAARGHEVVALGARRARHHRRPARSTRRRAASSPDAIVNCAAWTDVDGAEAHEREAMASTTRRAACSRSPRARSGAKIVYPSTDYVFDGARRRPYVESDLPHPLSAYGRSKLAGETSVAVANPRHFIVRTSWLFGVGGHELRRDDAAPRRRAARGPRRLRPGRLPHLHARTSPTAIAAADRGRRLRHPPRRRRAARAPGSSSRRRSSTRPGSRAG